MLLVLVGEENVQQNPRLAAFGAVTFGSAKSRAELPLLQAEPDQWPGTFSRLLLKTFGRSWANNADSGIKVQLPQLLYHRSGSRLKQITSDFT